MLKQKTFALLGALAAAIAAISFAGVTPQTAIAQSVSTSQCWVVTRPNPQNIPIGSRFSTEPTIISSTLYVGLPTPCPAQSPGPTAIPTFSAGTGSSAPSTSALASSGAIVSPYQCGTVTNPLTSGSDFSHCISFVVRLSNGSFFGTYSGFAYPPTIFAQPIADPTSLVSLSTPNTLSGFTLQSYLMSGFANPSDNSIVNGLIIGIGNIVPPLSTTVVATPTPSSTPSPSATPTASPTPTVAPTATQIAAPTATPTIAATAPAGLVNLLPDSEFETLSETTDYTVASGAVALSFAQGIGPGGSNALTSPTTGTTYATGTYFTQTQALAVTAGTTITVSEWQNALPCTAGSIGFVVRNQAGTALEFQPNAMAAGATPAYESVTFAVPSGTTSIILQLKAVTAVTCPAGSFFFISQPMVAVASSFFVYVPSVGETNGSGTPAPATSPTASASPTASPSPTPTASPTLAPSPTPTPNASNVATLLSAQTYQTSAVTSTFQGFSYDKELTVSPYLFTAQNAQLIALFKNMTPNGSQCLLRIGGTSTEVVNTVSGAAAPVSWNATGTGGIVGQYAPADQQRLEGFLKATNCQVIYGIPYDATQNSSSNTSTAAQMSAEAASAVSVFGSNLYAFEIGNEPDATSSSETTAQQASAIQTTVAAVQSAAPGVPLVGPETGSIYMNSSFLAFEASGSSPIDADFNMLTGHVYVARPQTGCCTVPYLFANNAFSYGAQLLKAAETSANNLGGRIDEAGSYEPGGYLGASNAVPAAAMVLNADFVMAQQGLTGVDWHGGGNFPNNLGGIYAPISDDGFQLYNCANQGCPTPNIVSVNPEYYGMFMWQQMMAPGATICSRNWGNFSNTSNTAFQTYLVGEPTCGSGPAWLVVANDTTVDVNQAYDVGYPLASAASYVYQGPNGNNPTATTGETYGGAPFGVDGSWAGTSSPAQFSGSAVAFDAPPYTVTMTYVTQATPPPSQTAVIAQARYVPTAASTAVPLTLPTTPPAGTTLLAYVTGAAGTGSTTEVTTPTSPAWTRLCTASGGGGVNASQESVYYRTYASGDPLTYTFDESTSALNGGLIYAVQGVSTAVAPVCASTNAGSSTAGAAWASLTPNYAGSLVFASVATVRGSTYSQTVTYPAGFSSAAQIDPTGYFSQTFQEYNPPVGAAIAPSATFGTADQNNTTLVILAPVGATPTPSPSPTATATPTVSPTPTASPTVSPSPSPTPVVTSTPTSTPTSPPTSTPSASASPIASASPSPLPTASPAPSPTGSVAAGSLQPTVVALATYNPTVVDASSMPVAISTPAAGNLLLAFVGGSSGAFSPPSSPSWTLCANPDVGGPSTNVAQQAVYWRLWQTGDPVSYTFTSTSTATTDWNTVQLFTIQNESQSSPITCSGSGNNGNPSTVTWPSLTPGGANSLAFASIVTIQGATGSQSVTTPPASPFTLAASFDPSYDFTATYTYTSPPIAALAPSITYSHAGPSNYTLVIVNAGP